MNDLKTYDRENITERVILEIAPFMDMPEFQPDVIERASKACSGVCMWVRAMYKYYYVAKMVRAAVRRVQVRRMPGGVARMGGTQPTVPPPLLCLIDGWAAFFQVEPKKKKLVEAQERLDRTMADLNVAKQRLRDVLDRIADLEDQFTATQVRAPASRRPWCSALRPPIAGCGGALRGRCTASALGVTWRCAALGWSVPGS